MVGSRPAPTRRATTAGLTALALAAAGAARADGTALAFEGIALPTTVEAKLGFTTSARATVNGRSVPIGYMPLLRPGDVVAGTTFGQMLDPAGRPMTDKDGRPAVCNAAEFTSLLEVGGKLFMVNQFECTPGVVYVTEMAQDAASGALRPVSTKPIDLGPLGGGSRHCAGMRTPWNTHLSSEEILIDAASIRPDGSSDDLGWRLMSPWIGKDRANPYHWGWLPEITITDASGTAVAVKHYAMGRLQYEMGYVLPDERTVLLAEDNTNSPLALFVADRPRDLSAGTLYAARWRQTSGEGAGTAELDWIDLGHATNAGIGAHVHGGTRFDRIFEKAAPETGGGCPAGFGSINAQFGRECLKLRPGMETVASRLETGRYAALRGATTELSKAEGVTFDPERNRLYLAVASIKHGMTDNEATWDAGGRNDVRLAANPCGVVYALEVGRDARDDRGRPIDSAYVPTRIAGLLAGKPTKHDDPARAADTCDVAGIAGPDNLTHLPGTGTLIIAEDSTEHEIDMLWAMDLTSGELTRIQSSPYSSEQTGIHWYTINGWTYLTSVIMHPLHDPNDVPESARAAVTPDMRRSRIGVIGPFPELTR